MSHGEHQLPASAGSPPPPPPPSGYGPAASPSHPLPARTPSPSRVSVPLAVASAGGMPDAQHSLTKLERWAVRASDSQFNATAGAIGGFTSGVVTCPLDVIKTKLQAQGGFAAVQKGRHVGHHKVYEGLVGTAKVIWREEGVRGMYRGLGPIILGYLPTWAVWFTVYNKSKVWVGQHCRAWDYHSLPPPPLGPHRELTADKQRTPSSPASGRPSSPALAALSSRTPSG